MAHRISIQNGKAEFSYTGANPWHNLGEKVADYMTVTDAFARTLPWTVSLRQVRYADVNGQAFDFDGDEVRIIARDDTNGKLGSVTKSYLPIQNAQMGEMADAIVGQGAACVEIIGALDGGSRCFALISLSKAPVTITKSDTWLPYFLLAWGHDGVHPAAGKLTGTRVVCANTMSAAGFGDGQWSRTAAFTVKHHQNASLRIDEARRALGIAVHQVEETTEAYRLLAARDMTREECHAYFDRLFPYAVQAKAGESDSASIARLMGHTSVDHLTDAAKRSMERTDETRETLRYLLDHGKGSELAGRTAWGAYNAVTEYVDHVYPITQNGSISATRQQSILFGAYQKVKDSALTEALALVN